MNEEKSEIMQQVYKFWDDHDRVIDRLMSMTNSKITRGRLINRFTRKDGFSKLTLSAVSRRLWKTER